MMVRNWAINAVMTFAMFMTTFKMVSVSIAAPRTWRRPTKFSARARSMPSDVITQGGEDPDPKIREKRDFIKQMMKDAWDDYSNYAWGENELAPHTKSGYSSGEIFGYASLGVTIFDSIDTLYIMGLMDEFQKAKEFAANFSFTEIGATVSVFEVNIRIVGGLLSAYALTKDRIFAEKAEELATLLLPAFETPTGIPYAFVDLKSGQPSSRSDALLAELGSFHLEFYYLSDVTGNPIFKRKVMQIRKVMKNANKLNGLYTTHVNINDGEFTNTHVTIGGTSDSFFEYLLKSSIQSGSLTARQMYDQSMDAFVRNGLVKVSEPSGLLYIAESYNHDIDDIQDSVEHLACFAGGMFALGAYSQPNNKNSKRDAEIGRNFTNTCHESYKRSLTGLGPEVFHFNGNEEAKANGNDAYLLRPEVIESYFILYRITGDKKYRDWGWDAAQAIQNYAKVEPGRGYSGIRHVDSDYPELDNMQPSFFLAETLKYLYLLFSSNDLISLDQWVFNTEGHPLPILKRKYPNY